MGLHRPSADGAGGYLQGAGRAYGEDAGMWALVEVCEESIFLTNNLGGRTEYAADVELEDDGITVYRRKLEEGTV